MCGNANESRMRATTWRATRADRTLSFQRPGPASPNELAGAVLCNDNTGAEYLGSDQRLDHRADARVHITTLVNATCDAAERYGDMPCNELTLHATRRTTIRSTSIHRDVYTCTGRRLDKGTCV